MEAIMNSILLDKWNFHYNDCPEAWYKGYQDSLWEEVTVPHDWSVHMPFSKEYSSGTGYLAGGIGWYRTSFQLPEAYRNKRIFITFDGVYKNSQVWCNSYYMGRRPYGYSTFRYDITEQACFGELPNIIAVRVDHKDIADSRWFTGSGITRKVTVTIEEPVHSELTGSFSKPPWSQLIKLKPKLKIQL
jgi:beta-galactosidase/beta-glucuronidase